MSADDTLYEQGLAQRRKVLGAAHVARATQNVTPFDADFQKHITETVWAKVWTRSQLTLRERSLVTLAILAALGRDEEVLLHTRATANTGASAEDLAEVMLHVATYAGVPAANHAIKLMKSVLAEETTTRDKGEAT